MQIVKSREVKNLNLFTCEMMYVHDNRIKFCFVTHGLKVNYYDACNFYSHPQLRQSGLFS